MSVKRKPLDARERTIDKEEEAQFSNHTGLEVVHRVMTTWLNDGGNCPPEGTIDTDKEGRIARMISLEGRSVGSIAQIEAGAGEYSVAGKNRWVEILRGGYTWWQGVCARSHLTASVFPVK